MTMEAIEALFERVFSGRDGHMVICILQELVDSHPRTELDCARAVGMHKIIDSIVHYAGIFRGE
jgi:hypothetical protein